MLQKADILTCYQHKDFYLKQKRRPQAPHPKGETKDS
jgi:hypothetical protein